MSKRSQRKYPIENSFRRISSAFSSSPIAESLHAIVSSRRAVLPCLSKGSDAGMNGISAEERCLISVGVTPFVE